MSVADVAAFCQNPGIGIQMFGIGWRKPPIWSIIISSSSSSANIAPNLVQRMYLDACFTHDFSLCGPSFHPWF